MTKEKLASEATEFPLNQPLLDEASKLKEERRSFRERLAKIESTKQEVTKSVYEKVHTDYASKLQATTDKLLEKKHDIGRELATLYETRDKINSNLKNHKEVLEEIQFRYKLGEFSKEEFQAKAKEQEDKVARFEKVLGAVQANIKRYESIFEGEEDLLAGETPMVPTEELDEWEKEVQDSIGKEPAAPIANEPEWLEATKPNLQTSPQITIISGAENVGKSFSVNGNFTIGRSHTNKIILKDSKASRQHAEIRLRGNESILIDLNSSNGTLVNGQRIHEHILSPNDEIQIGDYILQYQQ